jgi:hypothetical protein
MPSTNGSLKIAIAGIRFSHPSIFINLLLADTRTDNKRQTLKPFDSKAFCNFYEQQMSNNSSFFDFLEQHVSNKKELQNEDKIKF